MNSFHTPVLLKEAVYLLNIRKAGLYIDCNLGGGGHTQEILKQGGVVLGIDWDQDAIEIVSDRFPQEINNDQLTLVKDNFANLRKIIKDKNIGRVDGVLFDLGVSSHQFGQKDRGFSFQTDAPLDMRMDQALQVKASDLVNGLNEGELSELFFKLGEEKFAKRVARRIVDERTKGKIETTQQLARIISSVVPKLGKIHPATKIFQALRIAVNDELNNLKIALPDAIEILNKGGRLVIISFHSLEDRIVKNLFNDYSETGRARIITEKPIIPSEQEVYMNPRSRSAKLRAAEKI